MKNNKSNTLYLAQLAMMIALTIIIANFGSILIGPLRITFATVPVAVAAIVLGPFAGFVCGTTFGICSLIQGITGASALTSSLIAVNAFYGFLLCVVARMLCGTLPAFIYKGLRKTRLPKAVATILSALSCPVLNTIFFMGIIVTLYWNTEPVQNIAAGLGTVNPLMFIVLLVGVQGVIEAVICAVIGGTVSSVLNTYLAKTSSKESVKPSGTDSKVSA